MNLKKEWMRGEETRRKQSMRKSITKGRKALSCSKCKENSRTEARRRERRAMRHRMKSETKELEMRCC